MEPIKVVVASTNQVKIEVAERGFPQMFTEQQFVFEGVSVSSNVPDQPMSYEETLLGALNRAYNARNAIKDADYWVGMEGGINITNEGQENERWETAAYIFVLDKEGRTGYSNTASIQLSAPVVSLIKKGIELSKADDEIFGKLNSGRNLGVTGILTDGLLPRVDYYLHALILALVPFKQEEFYFKKKNRY